MKRQAEAAMSDDELTAIAQHRYELCAGIAQRWQDEILGSELAANLYDWATKELDIQRQLLMWESEGGRG